MNTENNTVESKPRITKEVIARIMDRAVQIDRESKEHCRAFTIMFSARKADIFILRWATIDISDEGRPVQCYRYECFELDGTPQHCSIHYSDQVEANRFFSSLKPLYKQQYAIDHKL